MTKPKRNKEITALVVNVKIDNKQVCEMPIADALALAKEKGGDLIEIQPDKKTQYVKSPVSRRKKPLYIHG